MTEVSWACYPQTAAMPTARTWLQMQADLQLAPKTIDAYGRALDDYLSFCRTVDQSPEAASREHIARYVQALATRPNPHGQRILHLHSGAGLSNATMQQRLTVVRLFYDYLVEKGLCVINPVGRGTYVAGKGFGGVRDRALLAHFYRLPWIPTDDQWQALLQALQEESVRNRVMLLFAYDGALRREELVSLQTTDIDPPFRQLTIRAEVTKNRRSRVVFYSEHTDALLAVYLQHRRTLGSKRGPLFLSESRRNRGEGLSSVMWSKIVQQLAERAGVPQFTTHTPRHLRLTHMARAGMDLHKIAAYAGHQSTQTTMLYIHLSGQDLAASIAQGMAGIDAWLARVMESEDV